MPNWLEVLSSENVLVFAGVMLCIVVGFVASIVAIMHYRYELNTQWATLKKSPSDDQEIKDDDDNHKA